MSKVEKRRLVLCDLDGHPAPNINNLVKNNSSYAKEFSRVLNYFNNKQLDSPDTSRLHVEQYLKLSLAHIPEYEFNSNIGAVAWILNNAGYVEDKIQAQFATKINTLQEKYRLVTPLKQVKRPIEPQVEIVSKDSEAKALKAIQRLNYLVEDKNLNIKSIAPESIIGASALWVFNIKTNKLGVYIAQDDTGLTVKASSITNYDKSSSLAKKLKTPKQTLDKVLETSKVDHLKVFKSIKVSPVKMTGRINKNFILLKVVS